MFGRKQKSLSVGSIRISNAPFMKKSFQSLCRPLSVALVCFCTWTAYAQALKPQSQAAGSNLSNTAPIVTTPAATSTTAHALEPAKAISVHPAEITTVDGKTYTGLTVQKVDPDGLLVEYKPAGGGIGITKIKFKDLPANLQQQYNYDPDKVGAYETRQAQGMGAWRAQQQKEAEAARAVAAQRARQDALEQQQQAELTEREKREPPKMTEPEKKQAQKEIEATWSGFKAAVKAGRITN
jgi:hypothetical protein